MDGNGARVQGAEHQAASGVSTGARPDTLPAPRQRDGAAAVLTATSSTPVGSAPPLRRRSTPALRHRAARERRIKRLIDVLGAGAGLVVFSPVLAGVAVAIRLTMGTPVLFRQQRPGLHGRPFTLVKFRTMADAQDAEGKPLPDEARLTALGQFLRQTSLDELPELINVLRGEMSLVGPRPLLMQYLERYTAEEMRRHDVKPGVTGWAQIHGRASLSFADRFALDVWYVDHQSLWLDLKIIAATVRTILKREGISQEGYATGPEFMGSQPHAGDR